ncbi:RHG27 protein, partial [Nothocercus julius]|nr:RHG27 protein [Nothocercus julius]
AAGLSTARAGAPPRASGGHRDGPHGAAGTEGADPRAVPPQGRKEPEQPPEQPPEPVYLNIAELREEAAAGAAPPCGSLAAWEAHTDAGSGRVFYYNPLTGASTWECPVEEAEDG